MSDTSSSSSGLGCFTIPLGYAIILGLLTAYRWSGGLAPRDALSVSWAPAAWWTGGLCLVPVVLGVLAAVISVLAARARRRGW